MWQEQRTDSDKGGHSDGQYFSNLSQAEQESQGAIEVARAGETPGNSLLSLYSGSGHMYLMCVNIT
jgi:hypothetical protein